MVIGGNLQVVGQQYNTDWLPQADVTGAVVSTKEGDTTWSL